MSDYKSFLLSLILHTILFFCVSIFAFFSHNHSKNYIIKPSDGGALRISVITNEHIYDKEAKLKKQTSNKKIKNFYNAPHDETAKIKINEEAKKVEKNKSEKSSVSSGGSGNETTEVIPVLKDGFYISCIPPVYPRISLILREEGTVIIRVLVSNSGEIIEKILHKSSGYNRLDKAAMQASSLWKINEAPLQTSWIEVVINFIIR